MATEIKLPELGENIESGRVVNVLVKAGDTLKTDQVIMELETDKAVIEVPATKNGTIEQIMVKEGDELKVGQTFMLVNEAHPAEAPAAADVLDEQAPAVAAETQQPEAPPEPAPKPSAPIAAAELVEFRIPELGENIESGTVAKVLVAAGDTVNKDQALIELETDKAVVEVPSDISGVVKDVSVAEGDQVKVGQVILNIMSQGQPEQTAVSEPLPATAPPEASGAAQAEPRRVAAAQQFKPSADVAPAAPSVRRFAREIGIDINQVAGSGPAGRISIEDVKAWSKRLHTEKVSPAAILKGVQAEALPDFSKWGAIERQAMNKVRETTARHLSYAWATIPHVTQFDKADITDLEKLRKQFAPKAEAAGGKLTMTAILVKVVEKALKLFPQFNASVDMINKEIILKKYINIGLAVDTDRGLLVPVIKNVDQKNIIRLSAEITALSQKARDRKLALDEMQGGNFSISNLGGIGGTAFTPVVNSPEVAILGVSRSAMEPVYRDGTFVPRLMLPLSLSYDHRVIDGADAARFLRWVCAALEQPFLLSLEG